MRSSIDAVIDVARDRKLVIEAGSTAFLFGRSQTLCVCRFGGRVRFGVGPRRLLKRRDAGEKVLSSGIGSQPAQDFLS